MQEGREDEDLKLSLVVHAQDCRIGHLILILELSHVEVRHELAEDILLVDRDNLLAVVVNTARFGHIFDLALAGI